MGKHIKDGQTGKFLGSIGDGKTKTPSPYPKPQPHPKPQPYSKPQPAATEDTQIMVALIDLRALSQDAHTRGAAAGEEPINPIIAEYLLNDPQPAIPLVLADNPTLPQDILIKLSEHKNFNIRRATIETERLPLKQQQKLADDPHEEIRAAIALHTTNIPLIQKLAQENNRPIQAAAAINPNTPPETLTQISTSLHLDVQERVASNPNTPPKTLETLSRTQPNKRTLDALIDNPQTPPHVIENIFPILDEETQYLVVVTNKVNKNFIGKQATTHPSEQMRADIKYWLGYQAKRTESLK